MSTLTIDRKDNPSLSTHFKASEFVCPCGQCKTVIDIRLVSQLEAIRTLVGKPIKITSGYRCEAYQEQLRLRGYETAKGISQHTLGAAADISAHPLSGLELEKIARRVGINSVGVGKTWVHLDLRPGHRRWEYSK